MTDEEHNQFCNCDQCEGTHYLIRHRPASALFDGDFEHRGHGPQQRRFKHRQERWELYG